jgi:hypothetical protein
VRSPRTAQLDNRLREHGAIGDNIDRSDAIVDYRKPERNEHLAVVHPHRSWFAVD